MGILSGPEIRRQIELNNIVVDPFDSARIGPNSIDCCLGPLLIIRDDVVFDLRRGPVHSRTIDLRSPEYADGYRVNPGDGVLGHTVERIACAGYVPWIDGRSTVGRNFLTVHQTAGRADDGFNGQIVFEITATHRPVIIRHGDPIAQISFFTLIGQRRPYNGNYQFQTGPRLPKPLK